MMNTKTLSAILLMVVSAFGNVRGQKLQEQLVSFGVKNYEINDEIKNQIDDLVGRLKAGERLRLTFLDDNDKQKDEPAQMNIAKKRGEQVLQHFTTQRFHGVGFEPVMLTKSKKTNAVVLTNRDFMAMAKMKGITVIDIFRDPYWKPMYFIDPAATGPKPCQNFTFMHKNGGQIMASEGTIITIPVDAFHMSGCDEFQICLQEYYTTSDMLAAGLTTLSDGKLLVSEGMIFVRAVNVCTGEEIRLKKDITIAMPANKGDKKTQFFSGKREDLIINWKERELEDFKLEKQGSEISSPAVNTGEGEELETEGVFLEQAAFVFKTKRLEWINTDKYYEIKDPADLIVHSKELNSQTTLMVVLDKEKSIIPGFLYAGETTAMFQPLPPKMGFTAIAIRMIGVDYEMAIASGNTSDRKVELPAFKRMSEKEMKAKLSSALAD